jgi:hypothetical protein
MNQCSPPVRACLKSLQDPSPRQVFGRGPWISQVLDSGQKHAGMTARGLCESPSRDLFSPGAIKSETTEGGCRRIASRSHAPAWGRSTWTLLRPAQDGGPSPNGLRRGSIVTRRTLTFDCTFFHLRATNQIRTVVRRIDFNFNECNLCSR